MKHPDRITLLPKCFVHIFHFLGLDYKDSKADKGEMEKVASELHEHHVFEVELENLLGAQGPVKHPRILAKVIPNQICRCTVLLV